MPPALTNGEPGSSFQQQGTVDWGQLASRTATFSIDVLSRLSAANIDPYTLELGRIMCNQFQLSQEGQRNVQHALSTLYSYRLPGTLLWFGFGARHVVRQLPSTHQGFTCVALCGVLADYYHPDIAAEILSEMIKLLSLSPDILTPSILEWRNLVQACSGVFAASSFGTLVEELLQLNPYIWTLVDPLIACPFQVTRDGCASPRSIAEILQAIGRVSCGKLENISVVGGNDIGWLASLSEWLFGLRLRIENADGIGLYSNYDLDTAFPQITLKYSPRGQDPQAKPPSSELEVVSRTFVLEDATVILRYRPWGHFLVSNSGRIPWVNLLSRTFGNDFQNIMEQDRQTLATIFGSAARILLGIVSAEPGIPAYILDSWAQYNSEAYGRGFIQMLTERLPELAPLKVAIENSFGGSFDEAKRTYETQISRLRLNCACTVCKCEGEAMLGFCRVVIAETIIELALYLSTVEVMDGLYPKRRGLERLYEAWKTERMNYGNIDDITRFKPFTFRVIAGRLRGIGSILENCTHLFGGNNSSTLFGTGDPVSAISVDGIVIHAQILHKLSDNAEIVGKVFVGAGCIEHEGKRFFSIVDDRQLISRPENIWDSIQQYDQSKIVITQTIQGLEFHVELKASQRDALPVLRVLPYKFADAVARMRGLINCTGRDCMQVCSGAESASGWFDFLKGKVRVVRGNILTRTAAIHLQSRERGFASTMADNSCLQCCLRQAAKENIRGSDTLRSENLVIVLAEDG